VDDSWLMIVYTRWRFGSNFGIRYVVWSFLVAIYAVRIEKCTRHILQTRIQASVRIRDVLCHLPRWHHHLQWQLGATFASFADIFRPIRDAHLTLSRSKCQFAVADVDYLGHHVGLGCVQPRAGKVEAVLAYLTPTNWNKLQNISRTGWLLSEVHFALCINLSSIVRPAEKGC